jgi:pimeloyl-ACP methyl ester carboxylesterase
MTVDQVAVAGGALAVETYPGVTEPVLAVHGISSQRRLWNWLRASDAGITIVAPDLRGRADSVSVGGRSSVAQHADDMVAVLDHLELGAVHVCGMSMGGFVAVDLASRYPDRVKSVILVDGGFPMATPPGLTADLLPKMFADRLGRLQQVWGSLDEYLAFFTDNTAPLLDKTDPLLRDYLAHDLRDGRVRLSGEALLSDAESVFFGGSSGWETLGPPVRFLHAEWSTGAGSPPGYPPDAVEKFAAATVATRLIPEVDHAGSIMTPRGGQATAEMIREALAS